VVRGGAHADQAGIAHEAVAAANPKRRLPREPAIGGELRVRCEWLEEVRGAFHDEVGAKLLELLAARNLCGDADGAEQPRPDGSRREWRDDACQGGRACREHEAAPRERAVPNYHGRIGP
jgi:hypothetical protein